MKASKARCDECPLRDRPIVPGKYRHKNPQYIIVGEAPGANEARQGEPFVGKSGKLLDAILKAANIDPNRVYVTNAVLCHPHRNKLPGGAVECCNTRLIEELQGVKKKHDVPVIMLGGVAADALVGNRRRGCFQQSPVGPAIHLYHPAFLFHTPSASVDILNGLQRVKAGPVDIPDVKYTVLGNLMELSRWINFIVNESSYLAWDLETDYLNWRTANILCLAASWTPGKGIIIPQRLLYDERAAPLLAKLFEAEYTRFIAHNGKFDFKFVEHQLGITPRVDFDTLLAHYVLDERTGKGEYHSLKTLATQYLDAPDYEGHFIKKYLKRKKIKRYSEIPKYALYRYAAMDADYTLRLHNILFPELVDNGLWEKPFLYPIMEAVVPLIRMEIAGVGIHEKRLQMLEGDLIAERDTTYEKMVEISGRDFNPNSHQQKAEILYDELGCPPFRHYKVSNPRSTDKRIREMILAEFDERTEIGQFVSLLGNYARVEKLRSAYATKLLRALEKEVLYPEYKLHGAETGRLSAENPPIQTIPRANEEFGRRVKECFVPKASAELTRVIVQVDYSQAELRVAAALSGDPALLEIFNTGRDLHSEVARGIFGDAFSKEERTICKNFNFSYLYSQTGFGFMAVAGLPNDKAEVFVERFNAMFPVLNEWKQETQQKMLTDGEVTTFTGRTRRFPLIIQTNRAEAIKAGVSMTVQSAASDLTLISLIEIFNWIDAHPRLVQHVIPIITVHDSNVLEVTESLAVDVGRHVKETMEGIGRTYFPAVVWVADVEIGPNWGSLEKVAT